MASGGSSTAKKTPAKRKPGRPAGSTKKSTSSTAKNKKNTRNGKHTDNNPMGDEIAVLCVFACTILLLLSNFHLAGVVGEKIKWFMFGLFGIMEYIVPFIIAGTLIFCISNREYRAVARFKSGIIYVMTIVFAALIQRVWNRPDIVESTPMDIFYACAKTYSGGGFFAGVLCKLFSPLGAIGCVVILLLLLLIGFLLITEQSFINGMEHMRKSGSRMMHAAKQDYDIYREHSENRRREPEADELSEEEYLQRRREKIERRIQEKEEKKLARSQKKARGITSDIKLEELPQELPGPMDIHEIGNDISYEDEYTRDIYSPQEEMEEITYADETFAFDTQDTPQNMCDYEIESIVAAEDAEDVIEPEDMEDAVEDDMIHNVSERLAHFQGQTSENDEEADNDSIGIPDMDMTEESFAEDIPKLNADLTEEDIPAETPAAVHETEDDSTGELEDDLADNAEDNVQVSEKKSEPAKEYEFPPLSLLSVGKTGKKSGQEQENKTTALRLQQTLQNFGVKVTITDISCGPSVTRYELQPEQGVKVSKIVSLSDDIKLNLAAADIRIEAPIPGKAAIGIEVPNKVAGSVSIRELLESENFKNSVSPITFAVGKDIAGKTIVTDIAKMPHLLIAGATGSGKSVCINTIIMSILYKANPEDVKMIMIDPKMVELRVYDGIPHLMIPVVIDPKKASGALNWAVNEMTDRYKKFAQLGVRDLKGYNKKIAQLDIPEEERPKKMPQLVIIIDELADLMMVAPGEVEDAICRLAQLARAAGIHLVIATQRPSVNVITGLIKANVPSRIAFSVSSGVDSRTIIDMNGAEKLLGKGDMLFFPSGYPKPLRVQGAFVSDDEVSAVVDFLKEHAETVTYDENVTNTITSVQSSTIQAQSNERDAYFEEAAKFVIEKEKASIGMLQRYYRIGFNRAARLIDQLADAGIVGPEIGTKPRKVLMTLEEFEEYLKQQ